MMRETLKEAVAREPGDTCKAKYNQFIDKVSATAEEFIKSNAHEYRVLQHFIFETRKILDDLPRAASWYKDTPDIDDAVEIFIIVRQRLDTMIGVFERYDFDPQQLAEELSNWRKLEESDYD